MVIGQPACYNSPADDVREHVGKKCGKALLYSRLLYDREIAPTVLAGTHFQAGGSKGQKEIRTMLFSWNEGDI